MLIMILIYRKILTMTEFTSVDDDYARHKKLMLAIDKVFNENAELLDNIGSDYDENGKPYWDERA